MFMYFSVQPRRSAPEFAVSLIVYAAATYEPSSSASSILAQTRFKIKEARAAIDQHRHIIAASLHHGIYNVNTHGGGVLIK